MNTMPQGWSINVLCNGGYQLRDEGNPRLEFDSIWSALAYCSGCFIANEALALNLAKAEANVSSLRRHCETLESRVELLRAERDNLLRELVAERIIHGLKE